MDDAHHVVFDCVSMGRIRWNHPSLFRNGPRSRSLDVFMVQNPVEVAAFVYECKEACLAMSSLSDLDRIISQQIEIYAARIQYQWMKFPGFQLVA